MICYKTFRFLRDLLTRLGFLVNEAKSHLIPSSRVDFLGPVLDLEAGTTSSLPARIDSLVSCAEGVRRCRSVEARQFLRFLGLTASTVDVVPWCRLLM